MPPHRAARQFRKLGASGLEVSGIGRVIIAWSRELDVLGPVSAAPAPRNSCRKLCIWFAPFIAPGHLVLPGADLDLRMESSVISIEPFTAVNTFLFDAVRFRALQDAPHAFGSTYAKEAQLADADWIKRVER